MFNNNVPFEAVVKSSIKKLKKVVELAKNHDNSSWRELLTKCDFCRKYQTFDGECYVCPIYRELTEPCYEYSLFTQAVEYLQSANWNSAIKILENELIPKMNELLNLNHKYQDDTLWYQEVMGKRVEIKE